MFGNKKEVEKRFELVTEESTNMVGFSVLRDKLTGVNYLVGQGMNGLSMIPLLDKDGKVLVTESNLDEE